MNIDYGSILTKAAARQKALEELLEELKEIDVIQTCLISAKDRIELLQVAYAKVDREGVALIGSQSTEVANQLGNLGFLKGRVVEAIGYERTYGVHVLATALNKLKES